MPTMQVTDLKSFFALFSNGCFTVFKSVRAHAKAFQKTEFKRSDCYINYGNQ